jgi:ATP-dependent exoDNAse (exonuclease V) alpha subunit
MSIINDTHGKYQNGSLGTVKKASKDFIEVLFDNGNNVIFTPIMCEITNINPEKAPVNILQYPLRGGAAITIHKSQGQTFESANIMATNCWEPGQLYVALSRVKTIKGIHLIQKLTDKSLKTDEKVIEYYTKLQNTCLVY